MKDYSLRLKKLPRNLASARKTSFSLLVLFLFLIPLVTILVVKPTKVSRAYFPATPPVTPPITLSPTPTAIPKKCSFVYGYVRDSSRIDAPGISGATVTAHGINNSAGVCMGGHFGCTTSITNQNGYWQVSCNGDMACVGVYETLNAQGYQDSSKYPTGPTGSTAWGVNQIMWNNPPLGNCGPFIFWDIPTTPTTTPTLTPSPTPTPISRCSLNMSQTLGNVKWSINNTWQHYVEFIATTTGLVDKISVKAGNYGGAQRSLTCKVTRADGSNVSKALNSSSFTSTSGAQWRNVDFKNDQFSLIKGQTYRLYCKGPDSWNSLYWLWEASLGGIKGKTYKIFLCPASN